MIFDLTVVQENFLDIAFGNEYFRDISNDLKQELKHKSKGNIMSINNLLQNFNIKDEDINEYKNMPIYKSKNGFYYYDFEKRLLPIIDPNKKKFKDIKVYPQTLEHLAGYLSTLQERVEQHNDLVEKNRENITYRENKSSKLEYRKFYEIIRDSFNESLKMHSDSYKYHYGISVNTYDGFENEESNFGELKNIPYLIEKIK